jgi:putative flippase GtrA
VVIKFLKYNVVQAIAYGIELGVFFVVLHLFPGWLVSSNVAAKGSAGLFAFFVHKYVTFESIGKENLKGEALLYTLILVGNAFFGSFLLVIFVVGMPEWLAKISADVITVGVTFILTHNIVFRQARPPKNSD